MQKAFDLIRKQLEEQAIQYARAYDEDGMEEDFGGLCATNDAMLIVNQVAEEYKQEVCEWKQCGEYLRPYQTTSCEKFALHDISYVYCPYCGKRIKVIE